MAISDIFSQVKNNYRGTKLDVSSGLRKSLQDAENNFINKTSNAANAALTAGVDGLLQSAAQTFLGNNSSAQSTLSDLTGNIIGAGLQSFNLGGGNSSASYSNGITPGNSLSGIQARLDPLLSFSWYAELPVLNPVQPSTNAGGSMLASSLFGTSNDGIIGGVINRVTNAAVGLAKSALLDSPPSSTQCPWYYVEEANCPFRSFTTVSAFKEGRKRIYPGEYSVQDLVLGMYMDNSNISLAYLKTWESLILSQITKTNSGQAGGQFGLPSNYKKSIFVYLMSASKQQIMIIEYAECFPTNVHNLNLNSSNSTRLVANVNFSVGDVYTTIMPIGNSGISGVLSGALSIKGAAMGVANSGINNLISIL